MKLIRKVGLISIALSALMLHGCMVAAVGAGIGAVKWANAKKMEAKVKCQESYNTYLSLMLKSKKKPISMDEYCKN